MNRKCIFPEKYEWGLWRWRRAWNEKSPKRKNWRENRVLRAAHTRTTSQCEWPSPPDKKSLLESWNTQDDNILTSRNRTIIRNDVIFWSIAGFSTFVTNTFPISLCVSDTMSMLPHYVIFVEIPGLTFTSRMHKSLSNQVTRQKILLDIP